MTTASPTAAEWHAWARRERQEGRIARAVEGLRRALAADASSRAVRFDLASLLLDMGDVDGAGKAAAPLSDGVDRPDALWLCARLATARRDASEARRLLERLLAQPLNDIQRAEALLSLGIALGDLGDDAAAFTVAAAGKRLQRALHAARAAEREGEVAKLRRIGRWLAASPSASPLAVPQVAGSAATHVFLLGFPRSGTTLLEQVLAAHPGVCTLEEEPTLATAYQAFLSDDDACTALAAITPEEAAGWAQDYWRRVHERGVDAAGKLFVDKQPAGTLYLPLIARLFPGARILFALRDPRDVVLSCFRQPFAMNAMTYAFTDLAETAACYDACMTLAATARDRLPLAWRDVRHEALVDDFKGELARLHAFLGLEPAPSDFVTTANARPIRTPSANQVRAGLNRRGIGRWRGLRDQLEPVLPILAPWVERFGYDV